MTRVHNVTHRLSDQVRANGMALQAGVIQLVTFGTTIAVILNGLVDFKVVTPTGQFQPVVSEIDCLAAHRFAAQISPLTSEKSNGAGHLEFSLGIWQVDDELSRDCDTLLWGQQLVAHG